MNEFTVGQTLYYVPGHRRGNPREVTIAKVGRKYVEFTPDYIPRMVIESMAADSGDYSSRGRFYLSQSAYETEREASGLWDKLRDELRRKRRDGVDAYSIKKAAELLGIEL